MNFLTNTEVYPLICSLWAGAIVLISLGGAFCYARLCLNLWLEAKDLDKSDPLGIDFYAGKEPHTYADKLHKLLEQRSSARRLKPWWARRGYLIDKRAEVISTPSLPQFRDRAHTLPSLGELHTLTEEQENSRPEMAYLSSVVPSLLILGIGGTLYGVHVCLGHQDDNKILPLLLHAFKPSICAVFCTIVLMLLRGLHSKLLLQLLTRLDRYTLDTLIPCLQPNSTIELTSSELAKPIENFDNHMASLRCSESQVLSITNSLCTGSETQRQHLKSISPQLDTLSEALGILEKQHETTRCLIAGIREWTPQLDRHCSRWSQQLSQITQQSESICNCLLGFSKHFIHLKKSLIKLLEKQKSLAYVFENILTSNQNTDAVRTIKLRALQDAQRKLEAATSMLQDDMAELEKRSQHAHLFLRKTHEGLKVSFEQMERATEQIRQLDQTMLSFPPRLHTVLENTQNVLLSVAKKSSKATESIRDTEKTPLFSTKEYIGFATVVLGIILHFIF